MIGKIEREGGKCMGKKLYVGNLPFSVDQSKLEELFSSYGEIEEATVISDKFSGRSKGFGFVTFVDDSAGEKAIAEMNEKEIEGRALKVNEAIPFDPDKPRKDFGGGRGNSGGRFGGGNRFGGGRDRNGRDDQNSGTGVANAEEIEQGTDE